MTGEIQIHRNPTNMGRRPDRQMMTRKGEAGQPTDHESDADDDDIGDHDHQL